jgi:hypothetical protein
MEIITTIKDEAIRRQFDQKKNRWYFSIVDVVGMAAKSSDSRNYWKVLKNRFRKADNELVTQCNQLRMMANDGKFYMTDVADSETMLKILNLVSKENSPLFEEYFKKINRQSPKTPPYQGEPLVSSVVLDH